MTAPLSAERIKELKRILGLFYSGIWQQDDLAHADLLAILDEHAGFKAENELNKMLIADLTRDLNEENTRAEKAEAELAKQAPLVEAAMGATPWGGMNPLQLEFYPDDAKNILRAALALREGKK